jgi:hypothetical protein
MKNYYIIIDTETTITDKVVDFGAVVCDSKGNIVDSIAVMVLETFGVDELFYDTAAKGIWARESINRRMANYNTLLDSGDRIIASVKVINNWLASIAARYNPTLTAYNIAFDNAKCQNTGIELGMFTKSFCLWSAAVGNICHTKAYRKFVMQNHLFNTRTEKGNMTYSTTAESVCGYIKGVFSTEPHTALEDARDFELPILVNIIKRKGWDTNIKAYNWRDFQVKDWFVAK